MNWEKDTLCGRIEAGDYSSIKSDLEKVIGKKIADKIVAKQQQIVNQFNGINEQAEEEETDDTIDLDDVMDKVSNGDALTDEESEVMGAAIDAAKSSEKNKDSSDVLDAIQAKLSNEEELDDEEIEALEAALSVVDTVIFNVAKKRKKK